MTNYKLSSLSFTFIFICIINAMLPGTLIPYMLITAKTSVFISIFIGFLLGLLIIFLFFKIFDFLPEYSLFKKIDYVFPKFVSKIIVSIILLFMFIFAVFVFWRYSTFISLEFLAETPNSLITLILILPVIYSTMYDIDTLARISTFCVFIGAFLFFNNVISLFGQNDFSNLLPLLNKDFSHLSKSSVMFSMLCVVPILSLLVIPKNNIVDKENVKKSILIGYIINTICVSIIFLCIIGVLGIDVSILFTFPSYEVLKTINMFSFLDNIENINILIWVLFMTLSLQYNLQTIKTGLYEIFNVKTKKKQYIVMGIIISLLIGVIIYLIPYENYINKYKNMYAYSPFILLVLSVIIVSFVYVCGKIKMKSKKI